MLGNQGPGSITEALLKTVLQLQGTMRPEELISLMDLGGPSFALGDHADHVHVGYRLLLRIGHARPSSSSSCSSPTSGSA